jgi:hypothetical protein
LPKLLIWNATLIIFTDDASAVTTNSNIVDFKSNIKAVFEQLNNWFNLNWLPLNFEKKLILSLLKQTSTHNLDTLLEYDNKCISNIYYTNFLDIILDNTLCQKTHKDQISPKVSSAR